MRKSGSFDSDNRGNGKHYGRGGLSHRGRGRRGRPFDYGSLRLLVLSMIKDQPSHGYELIKAIEERLGGSYSPSPGVMYPTLSWLEDMGYTEAVEAEAGRKQYKITPEGHSFLSDNKDALDALLNKIKVAGAEGMSAIPPRIMRGMEGLKYALRMRVTNGNLNEDTINTIAAALETAATTVEKS